MSALSRKGQAPLFSQEVVTFSSLPSLSFAFHLFGGTKEHVRIALLYVIFVRQHEHMDKCTYRSSTGTRKKSEDVDATGLFDRTCSRTAFSGPTIEEAVRAYRPLSGGVPLLYIRCFDLCSASGLPTVMCMWSNYDQEFRSSSIGPDSDVRCLHGRTALVYIYTSPLRYSSLPSITSYPRRESVAWRRQVTSP